MRPTVIDQSSEIHQKTLLYEKQVMVRIIKNVTMKLSIQTLHKTTKFIKHLSLQVTITLNSEDPLHP